MGYKRRNDEAALALADISATARDHIQPGSNRKNYVPMAYNSFPRERALNHTGSPTKNWNNFMTVGTNNPEAQAALYAERTAVNPNGTANKNYKFRRDAEDIQVYNKVVNPKTGAATVHTTAAELGEDVDIQNGKPTHALGNVTGNALSLIKMYSDSSFAGDYKKFAKASTLYNDLFRGKDPKIKRIKQQGSRAAVVALADQKTSSDRAQNAIKTLNDYGIVATSAQIQPKAIAMHGWSTSFGHNHSVHRVHFHRYSINPGLLNVTWSPNEEGWLKGDDDHGEPADAVQTLCSAVGATGSANSTKCSTLYDKFYMQKKWDQDGSAAQCAQSKAAWNEALANPKRNSLIDGAEIGKSKTTFLRMLTSLASPEVGCVYTPKKGDDPKTIRRYVCTGLQYMPLTLEGLFVDKQLNKWVNPGTLTREVTVTPGNCMAKYIKVDGQLVSNWKTTGCARVQPGAVIECSRGTKTACFTQPGAPAPPAVAYGKEWDAKKQLDNLAQVQNWFTGTVLPYVIQNQQYYDVNYPTKHVQFASSRQWSNFREEVIGDADVTSYCNNDSIIAFLNNGRVPVGLPNPPYKPNSKAIVDYEENIWKNFTDLGLTEGRVVAIVAGAIPVGYLSLLYKRTEFIPFYLVAAVVGVVLTYGKKDANNKNNVLGELQVIYDDYKALIQELEEVETAANGASKKARDAAKTLLMILEHLIVYIGIFGVGAVITMFVVRETGNNAGAGALEIVPEEFLIGMGLTLLTELIASVVLGDFQRLIWAMMKGAFQYGFKEAEKIWDDTMNCALKFNCK